MQVRNQVIKDGKVELDIMLPSRNVFVGLHELLKFHSVTYRPEQFVERGGWVQFSSNGTVYRTMSSRRFG